MQKYLNSCINPKSFFKKKKQPKTIQQVNQKNTAVVMPVSSYDSSTFVFVLLLTTGV